MADFIVKYATQRPRAALVSRFEHARDGLRGNIEAARFERHGHDGEPRCNIVPGRMG